MRKDKLKGAGLGIIFCLVIGLVMGNAFGYYETPDWISAPLITDSSNNTVLDADNRSLENGPWWMQLANGVVKEDDLGFGVANQSEFDTHTGNTSIHWTKTWANTTYLNNESGSVLLSNLGFDTATQTEFDTHTGNTSNPHSVTYSQTGGMNGSACPDGEVRIYNATSNEWECNATASGSDGYLPDDPATSDVDMNNYNVTGIKESVSSQSTTNQTSNIGANSNNGVQWVNGSTYKIKDNQTGWYKYWTANMSLYCWDEGNDRGCN